MLLSRVDSLLYVTNRASSQGYSMNEVRHFHHIKQKFSQPSINSYGKWSERESIVLFTQFHDGSIAFGEVTPTPGFLSLDFENAIQESKKWAAGQDLHEASPLAPALNCLRAEFWNPSWIPERKEIRKCRLFFNNESSVYSRGAVKRKVGLLPEGEEIPMVKDWVSKLPANSSVRLDPNQSLDPSSLKRWIDAFCEEEKIQFIEQPMPHSRLDEMFEMAMDSPVPLALDESIIEIGCMQKVNRINWNGYFVIKPSLLKDWSGTIDFIRENPIKSVLSTVFESSFGYEALARCCSFSLLDAGIERKVYEGGHQEFPEHHKDCISLPCIANQRLLALWNSL